MSALTTRWASFAYLAGLILVGLLVSDIWLRLRAIPAYPGIAPREAVLRQGKGGLSSPEADAVQANYIKAFSRLTYAPFFVLQRGKWTADQEQHLGELLAQRALDAAVMAGQHQRDPEGGAPTDAAIAHEYSSGTLEALRQFEQRMPLRNRLLQLIQTLLYDGDELSVAQLEGLLAIMQENAARPLRLDASITQVDAALESARKANANVLTWARTRLSPGQFARLELMFAADEAYSKYFRLRRAHPAP